MTESDWRECKLLAFLLDYPETSWCAELPELRGVVHGVADERHRLLLGGFLTYAERTPPLELQETYTAAFDLDPATSLHLTYHLMGDSEDRGKALARLLWLYHREGFDAEIGELPDYLPMILEFLALCPEPEDALLRSCLGTVAILAERLIKKRHPYAVLLELAADIFDRMGIPSEKISKEV
ncbi:MAG: NarJ [uncultured bacterium]|nr:MAG: NarJ [uncultured bacterium]HBG21387.1 nitrate reductase molybdenum cofactor assembly chaperone [Desulfobulbaceae bacterium]